MSETQSRYGIMEELNNRKIKEKEKLANIERDTDNKTYETERHIDQLKQQIAEEQNTYKQKSKDKIRHATVNLALVTGEYNRTKDRLEELMKTEEETCESNFESWKADKQKEIENEEENFERYTVNQDRKIKEKIEVINEIENGIKSLKEISKDQKKEE